MTHSSVFAVIVTYHPDIPAVSHLIARLEQQVDWIAVIDNATPGFMENPPLHNPEKTTLIANPDNLGLATAYNQGIELARARGATHIILFDQDSLPALDMVDALSTAVNRYNHDKLIVAAVGPKYCDVKGQSVSPFVRIKRLHLERIDCKKGEVAEVDHLISSGSLIDMRAFNSIGTFSDSLFIDCIDTEWCLRARKKGYTLLGVGNALMTHNIGEYHLNIFGRQLPMHSPLRIQYQFRNQIWIIKNPNVSWQWKIIDAIRCLKLIAVYCLFAPNKLKNLYAITKGLIQGIRNTMGKIDTNQANS
jgi:rhamnosyltransferase